MVATFGLGCGVASLERAIKYSKERIQFGSTLSEKQGYTHGLLVPNAVQLEAARAYIEETARRLDTIEDDLQVEGSIAKYFATEAGDAMANDGIQAFGGYGYTREYEVEKIKRDVKILTIYEGTSEIQKNIISVFRLRTTVRSKGRYYLDMADALEKLPESCGGRFISVAIRILNQVILNVRAAKLTKSQHVLFLLADMMTWCEVGKAFCEKAVDYDEKERTPEYMKAAARLFARDVSEKVYVNGLKIACGCDKDMPEALEGLNSMNLGEIMKDRLRDMDAVAEELVK
jgi:alkylation response protein AidB-like acyl-CoA dehydrogenase